MLGEMTMGRWFVAAIMMVSPIAAAPAMAGDRGPVCQERSVVDEITREIRDRDYYSRVNPELVTEAPTQDPTVVRCQVCVQPAPYEMTRFGGQPIARCLEHGFEVRILHSGFVVQDLR
jgi:hypothetical protein